MDELPVPRDVLILLFVDSFTTKPLLLEGGAVLLAALELRLPVLGSIDDSGYMPAVDASRLLVVETEPLPVLGTVPVAGVAEGVRSNESDGDPPVDRPGEPSDGKDGDPLGPKDIGELLMGYEALVDGLLPLIGDVKTSELDAAGLVDAKGSDGNGGDDAKLEVPGLALEGRTPLFVEFDPQPVGPVEPGRDIEGVVRPVKESLVGEEMVTTVTFVVVRSVIRVVDSLVAVVVI